MGCSNGTHLAPVYGSQHLDPRVPFTPKELNDVRCFWQNVKRRFEDTAKESFIRFFRHHPYFQALFPEDISGLKNESDMIVSAGFEGHALAIFTTIDDVIEHLDKDFEGMVERLERIARRHAKVTNFHSDFFKYMEEPFLESLQEKHWDNYSSYEEELFRKLFQWMEESLSLEVEAIEYKLIPGD